MYGVGIDMTHLNGLAPEQTGPAAYLSATAPIGFGAEQVENSESVSSYGAGSLLGTSSVSSTSTKLSIKSVDQRTLDQQMGLPFLDSNPGAPATLYLDFNGNFERDWWHIKDSGVEEHFRNITTPVFDTDGNANSFGTDEQNLIKNIWARVAEDYAPFNINVSTAYYGSFDNGKALHVVIGGNNTDWLKENASGIASINSFSNSAPNVVFAFDLVAWAKAGVTDSEGRVLDGAAATATTASHEAGHAFGLRHQALYKFDGTKITDYSPGSSGWTPIMGDNKASDRTTWSDGTTDQRRLQVDMDVIARSANGFGYRADDHGSSIATASTLWTNIDGASLTGKGIINSMYDSDFFKFTSGGGQFQVNVNAAKFGPNLIPIAELWSTNGFVARADAGSLTQSIIHANVPAGTYIVVVKGFGDYGDVGQYTVYVSFSPTLMQMSSALASDTTTTTTTTSGGTYQDPLLAQSTSATLTTSSSSMGAGQSTTPMSAPLASQSAVAKQKLASRTGLHDDLFALESFVDELGDIAALHSPRREES
jgi:hypothetical protein